MVSLAFKQPFRSILSLPPTVLPDLAVITGINGSGKSHFLEAVKAGAITVEGIKASDDDIRLFNWTNLVPNNAGVVDPIQIGRERANFLTSVSDGFARAEQNFIKRVARLNAPFLAIADVAELLRMEQAEFLQQQGPGTRVPNRWPQFDQWKKQMAQECIQATGNNPYILDLLSKRAEERGIPLSAIELADIETVVPLNWNPTDMFQQNFSQIFAAYHRAWDENRYKRYANDQLGEANLLLSEDEFRIRFGEPPWDFVNRILTEAHLDYTIKRPSGRGELPFEARLINRTSGIEVPFGDLSSGEKIIMSFALCFYNASDTMRHVRYPKLLLLDEVDAPLHPTMTRDLIRVMERVLVREKGVKIVLTTHSPATVAFAPAGSLFQLSKQPRSLALCSREQAIQTLTSGYISVTESSRFVLTEAKQDRLVYTAICRKLVERDILSASPNLVFIQASDKKDRNGGGREQVKDWGAKLPGAGLKDVFGLIDRDAGNIPSATIKVLARYSLENYLLDPILVYAVFMHHGVHLKVHDAKIKDGIYFELPNATQATLQGIVDKVCSLVEQNQPQVKVSAGAFVVDYVGGKSISAPAWLRDFRGHDLEAAFRETFRAVIGNGFVVTQNDCGDLSEMLSERISAFVPLALLQVFQ